MPYADEQENDKTQPIEPAADMITQGLAVKAAGLRANIRWVPTEFELQRGCTIMLDAFEQPGNLPLIDFARLANVSLSHIHADIHSRRLLALNVGPRVQLPDWQLDSVKRYLTQTVLQAAEGIDNWTLYRVLSEPLKGLDVRSPVDAVRRDSIEKVARAVLNALGVQVV